ncbi:MAG: hypothetical protein CVU42_16720 [Chloroflexi bacterium HGW-Chloroflexi-4]|jgi:uncharacterized protein (TIGR03663 family)|nr:MAG: hypothetical protein CVU42_16720 [Chloroflexi bacterium HGW-Chloroflexi-4]
MENSNTPLKKDSWLDRPVFTFFEKFKIEHLLIAVIILLTVLSRFYMVGVRSMAHDEVNHVVPSYDLYLGKGYSHDPVTHGPMQFHLLAASYALFGDSDFSSRIPAALFSIATVVFVLLAWKRYLGRIGALLAGVFFLISPFMLFYGRYVRNEAFVGLFSVILLYAVLYYMEKGKYNTLYLYSAVLALYFCTKETSFIFTAEILIFLAFAFIKDVTQKEWKKPQTRDVFILIMLIGLLLLGLALGAGIIDSRNSKENVEAISGAASAISPELIHIIMLVSVGLAAAAIIGALVLLILGLGWKTIRNIRSIDLLILTFTMVMPQLIAFPINLIGWNPLDYSQPGLVKTSIVLAVTVVLALAAGLLWKPLVWLKNAAIFYAIFTILYTTMFTNGQGFFTGMVGSLGYWLSQQSVNRGTQPWYYYSFIQIPMYEYLAAMGAFLALILALLRNLFSSRPNIDPVEQAALDHFEKQEKESSQKTHIEFSASSEVEINSKLATISEDENPKRVPVVALLLYWSVMSLIAYSVAGEKMPWLTVHITLPMLLVSGFSIGYLVDSLTQQKWNLKSLLSLLLFPILLISFSGVISTLVGPNKPFAGMELAQLQTTSTFIFSLLALGLSGWGIVVLMKNWQAKEIVKTMVAVFFGILALLTARSAYQANFINYDNAKEFLVYAHSAQGPKDVFEEVEDISKRTTGGKDIKVAYIGDALYPYWWYFRDYPNKTWLKDKLTRDLTQYPIVISDDTELEKTRAILDDNYYEFRYIRLVWPMQDYMNQTLKSVWTELRNPEMVQAIRDIWLNKDYTKYAAIKNLSSLTEENWEPSGRIYLFIQKSLVSSIWTYGTVPSAPVVKVDPYAASMTMFTPDLYFGSTGIDNGQFTGAHDLAIGPTGDIYVSDARNHRIQRFTSDGQFISTWGSFATVDQGGNAPGGTFNEPWGIAVAPDGSVYVADTWNYRIQKFTADGKFITMWGTAGTAESPDAFWGPRGIVVNASGQVLVTDTGNNRVLVYDANGGFLSQFGVNGMNAGEFDEPVGLAIDTDGLLYVVDTWNQRIQVFQPLSDRMNYGYLREWTVEAWEGQSINNKPYIDVDNQGHVFVTDPDAYRILEFDNFGNFIRGWGDYSSGIDGFGMPIGIAVDSQGRVWVSDADNGYMLRFTMPQDAATALNQPMPELPASTSPLTFNMTTGMVDGPLGSAVYHLSEDGSQWVPVVPDGIAALIPAGTQPILSETGLWQLLNTDGTLAFEWQPDVLFWISNFDILPTE